MIQVTIMKTNTDRKVITISPDVPVKQVLEENDVNLTSSNLHMDGCPLSVSDINKTFAELGVTDKCFITNIVKADNAI